MSKKKKNAAHVPHDAVVRFFLSHLDVAWDFIKPYLPVSLLRLCDKSTLRSELSTFVDEDLSQYASDIVMGMETIKRKGGYAYILIEHQSTLNKEMAARLAHYMMSIMHRHFREYNKVVPVVPILLYQGTGKVEQIKKTLHDCFVDPELSSCIDFNTDSFVVIDLLHMSDEEIMKHGKMSALLLAMKYARKGFNNNHLLEKLPETIKLLPYDLSVTLLNYIVNTTDDDHQTFVQALEDRLPEYKEAVVNVAEQLREEGRKEERQKTQQVIQEERQKGIQEGIQEKAHQVVQQLLKIGMPLVQIQQVSGLSAKEVQEIEAGLHGQAEPS